MAQKRKRSRKKKQQELSWLEQTHLWLFGPKRKRKEKNSTLTLLRDSLAYFFLVFGLFTLFLELQGSEESVYGLSDFPRYMFASGSVLAALVSLFWSFVLLYPYPIGRRLQFIGGSFGVLLILLGFLEIGNADRYSTFNQDASDGGYLGYQFDQLFVPYLGGFLTGVLYLAVLGFSLLLLFNISLQRLAIALNDGAKAAYRYWEKALPSLIPEKGEEEEYMEEEAEPLRVEKKERGDQGEPNVNLGHHTETSEVDLSVKEQVSLDEYRDYRHREQVAKKETAVKPARVPVEDELQELPRVWKYPSLNMFDKPVKSQIAKGDLKKKAKLIENTLNSFAVDAKVVEINVGPTITQYALEPAVGVKVSKITNLQNDLQLALANSNIRIESPIPNKPYVGVEVPNLQPDVVTIRGLLQSDNYQRGKNRLPLCLGRGVSGEVMVADLAKMPHLLVAGATGSGKSVCVNSIVASVLYKYHPQQVKFIMVDPKVVELNGYNGIPHLLTPVINRPEPAISSLKWAINEMERRYRLFAQHGARSIQDYNEQQVDSILHLPYIVIIIDELADLMMAAGNEVEEAIVRLAQKARATGIHLVLATQRPSVDVVTGLIKANVPGRVAFAVSSQVDSRVVLDVAGAEKLLGKGDMLYQAPDLGKMIRLQGVFVSDQEINKLVDFWKAQGEPHYLESVTTQEVMMGKKKSSGGAIEDSGDEDELLMEAYEVIHKEGRGSASLLQRRLRVGYARAARLIDLLEDKGVLSAQEGSKPREILRPLMRESSGESEE